MAKEIVTWCEIHLQAKEERVPGAEREITVDGNSFILDLCEDCRSQHLTPLVEVLDTYGQKVAVKAKKKSSGGGSSTTNKWTPDADGKFRCKVPGCERRAFDTAQGIGRHSTSHDGDA